MANPQEIVIKDTKITFAMWGPMNKTIIVSGQDGSLRVFDTNTLQMVQENRYLLFIFYLFIIIIVGVPFRIVSLLLFLLLLHSLC